MTRASLDEGVALRATANSDLVRAAEVERALLAAMKL